MPQKRRFAAGCQHSKHAYAGCGALGVRGRAGVKGRG